MSIFDISDEEKNEIRKKHKAATDEFFKRLADQKSGLKKPEKPEKSENPKEEKKEK